jgi:hypothetical protein
VYEDQQKLHAYFASNGMLKKGDYIYFSKRDFLDNIFIGYSLLPTKDVTRQVYRSNPGTYDYSALIEGMNKGFIKYIVTPTEDSSLNAKDEEVPFIHFSDSSFTRIADVAGHSIYQYREP